MDWPDGSREGHRPRTNDGRHNISARQAMLKQWQHVWRTGNTGRFAHSIQPVISVIPWFDGQARFKSGQH
jgi:hypothetical protein